MPPRRPPSVRLLAKETGFSKATVANALNGSPSVAAATRRTVRAVAAKLGYQRNPVVGAFMSAMRRAQRTAFRGVLAVVEIVEPDRPRHGPFHREILRGCTDCADELGFTIEFFQTGPTALTPRRLCTMLKARGIRGVVVLPTFHPPDFSGFDWSHLGGVYADYTSGHPALNSVCCDHYRSIFELLQLLRLRGYRRPGLVLESGRDERLHFRAGAALHAFQVLQTDVPPTRALVAPRITHENFLPWLAAERPDVVLGHDTDQIEWLEAAGRRVPRDVGFVALNLAKVKRPCAALNLHPEQIGRCAVEVLIGQIQRQAWGAPRFPTNTSITGELADGATIRRRPRSPDRASPPA